MIDFWFFSVYISTSILTWLLVELRKELKSLNKKRILFHKIKLNKNI